MPHCSWGHSGGPDPGSTQVLSVCGRTADGRAVAGRSGGIFLTGHAFLLGPDQYQRARGSWLVGPMRVSQKHCVELVEGTSNHSLGSP